MAGTELTRDLYDDMVDAYRECPGNASRAARTLGVDRRMTTRGWTTGWEKYAWARPIKEVLAEEGATARKRLAALQAKASQTAVAERDAAREKGIQARVEEEHMIDVARKDVLGALIIAAELTPAMRTLGKLVVDSLKGGDLSGIGGPKKALDLVMRHASLIGKAVNAADAVVKLSRLDRGASTAHIGVIAGSVQDENLTYEEAKEELESAADLLLQIREAGELDPELELALREVTVDG